MENRRRHDRVSYEGDVAMYWAWGEAIGRLRNLSESGALVALDVRTPPEQGTAVDVEFGLPGLSARVRRGAVVRWALRDTGVVVGLEFDRGLDDEALEALFALDRQETG